MKDDAVYIMSGIIDTRGEEVKASVSKYFDIIEEHRGFVLPQKLRLDIWLFLC